MIINCKEIAKKWKNECMDKKATLAIVQIGDNPASNSYIKGKLKDCEEIGFIGRLFKYSEDVSESFIIHLIETLNKEKDIDGIIVQLPLPKHMNTKKVVNSVAVEKDVDGFLSESKFEPCTALGVIKLLEEINYNFVGANVVVFGRSEFIGKKIADMLLERNATVTICHSKTTEESKKYLLKNADLIITAVGKPNLVNCNDIKKGATVIDVGINKVDGKLCGDFTPPEDGEYCNYTTVPGGVGLLTRAMLMKNTYEAKVEKL